MRVWPGRAMRAASIMSAQTSRSSAFAPARANAIGSPEGVATRCSRRPQNQRECDAHQPYWGPSREAGAFLGLAAGAALDRRGVHQPHVVVPRLALACEASHDTCDHLAAAPQPLVVPVAVGQIGEPRPQMRSRVAHELRLVVIAQQRRDHRQGDQLRVRQLRGEPHRRPLRRPPRVLRQQVIDPHIQCGREGDPSPGSCSGPPRSRCCFTPRAWTPSPHHRWTRPLGTNHLAVKLTEVVDGRGLS